MTAPAPRHKQSETGVGPVAAIIIVVALFIFGGIYFFLMQAEKLHQATPLGQEQANS